MLGDTYDGPLVKPEKGAALMERRQKRAKADAHEKRQKAIVRARDQRCRWPGCRCHTLRLPLEVAHVVAKSLGGSSDADNMILLDLSTHRGSFSLHSGDREIRPQTARGTNGPCDFLELHSGEWVVVGRERSCGVLMPKKKGLCGDKCGDKTGGAR